MKSVWCLWCVWRGFSEDGQPCIIDYKTLLQCYFIFQAQLVVNWGFIVFIFSFVLMCAPCLPAFCVCVMLSPTLCPLSPTLSPITPSGRLNGRNAENNSLISTSLCTCSTLTKNCTRQKTKVGRDAATWNNGRVKYSLMVTTPTLTQYFWLYFELCGYYTHICVYVGGSHLTACILWACIS